MPTPTELIDPVLNLFTTSEGWLAFSLGVLGKHIVLKLYGVYDALQQVRKGNEE